MTDYFDLAVGLSRTHAELRGLDSWIQADEPDPHDPDIYQLGDEPCEWCGLGPQECRCVPFDEEDDGL